MNETINLTNSTDNHESVGLADLSSGELTILILISLVSCATVIGNALVILIILLHKRLYQNVTNCFIISLASADLLLGALVLPFAVIEQAREFYSQTAAARNQSYPIWPYGHDWCDIWHALDVLSSTASVLSLCFIAVERYIAISDPLNYQRRMTHSRSLIMTAVGWVASMLISFPAIYWWRQTATKLVFGECHFSDNQVYLFVSSCISFYIPLLVMIFVYLRIYRTANTVQQSLASGRKVIRGKQKGESIVLGVHRGKPIRRLSQLYDKIDTKQIDNNNSVGMTTVCHMKTQSESATSAPSRDVVRTISSIVMTNSDESVSSDPTTRGNKNLKSQTSLLQPNHSHTFGRGNFDRVSFVNKRSFKLKRILNRFATERRAARTLGIIMGVFIVCWLPFVIYNTVAAIYPDGVKNFRTLFVIVTWLGYVNSSVNPFLYAYSLRDIRRAFAELCRLRTCRRRLGYGNSCGGKIMEASTYMGEYQTHRKQCNADRSFNPTRSQPPICMPSITVAQIGPELCPPAES